jgi:hypothetical protein
MINKSTHGRRSSLESHPQREKILAAIARHMPVKLIVAEFGVGKHVIYRWIVANRLASDRLSRRALRQLHGETLPVDLEGSTGDDLADQIRDLEVQKKRMVAVQDTCLKIGDLQRAGYISDIINRCCRHIASISEVLRLRLLPPNFVASDDYKGLKKALLRGPPEIAEHAAKVLERFETESKLDPINQVVANMDEWERKY